jgi:hypothetical protein
MLRVCGGIFLPTQTTLRAPDQSIVNGSISAGSTLDKLAGKSLMIRAFSSSDALEGIETGVAAYLTYPLPLSILKLFNTQEINHGG